MFLFVTVDGLTEYAGVNAAEPEKRCGLAIDRVRLPADRPAFLSGMRRAHDPFRRQPQHGFDLRSTQCVDQLIHGQLRRLDRFHHGQQNLAIPTQTSRQTLGATLLGNVSRFLHGGSPFRKITPT